MSHPVRVNLIFVGVEVAFYVLYFYYAATFHWFLHFFVGAAIVLILMSILMLYHKINVRWPFLWLFVGHLVAMFPDVLFRFLKMPHQHWMDIFILHIRVHFIPGRIWSWYAIFMLACALYLWSLHRLQTQTSRPAKP